MSMATQTITHENIVQTVQTWSDDRRWRLVEDILRSMNVENEDLPVRKRTLNLALGLLATDNPPPTDEEIAQWLTERRMEKYGA
jgi:hypothetical protein